MGRGNRSFKAEKRRKELEKKKKKELKRQKRLEKSQQPDTETLDGDVQEQEAEEENEPG